MSKADDGLGPGLGFEKGAAADAADAADGNVVDSTTSFSQTVWWPNTAFHSLAAKVNQLKKLLLVHADRAIRA